MPRPSRLVQPGQPLHITQRGVDRCPTFLADEDFAFYRLALQDAAAKSGCAVHAYVLMTNHVHLLVTPDDVDGPARMMQALGRYYVPFLNHKYHRTGTLWEGRFRSVLVSSERYFLSCSQYIELNPVHAGLAPNPRAYEWSSFSRNAHGDPDQIVSPHPLYLALGGGREECCAAYRALFATELPASEIAAIRIAPLRRRTLPISAYQMAVEALHPGSSNRAPREWAKDPGGSESGPTPPRPDPDSVPTPPTPPSPPLPTPGRTATRTRGCAPGIPD